MFVERNVGGDVIGVYARPQPGRAGERLAETHPDIIAFRAASEAAVNDRAANAGKVGNPTKALRAVIGWIEANPGSMTPEMQQLIDRGNAP